MQTAFAGPVKAHPAELQELVEECRASAHDARLAKAQLQDQRDEIEALQERMRVEAAGAGATSNTYKVMHSFFLGSSVVSNSDVESNC